MWGEDDSENISLYSKGLLRGSGLIEEAVVDPKDGISEG